MNKVGTFLGSVTPNKYNEYLEYLYSVPFIKRDRLNLPDSLTYGCEIEVENLSIADSMILTSNFNSLYPKEMHYTCYDDCTVDSEFVTPKSTDSFAMWNQMDHLLSIIRDNDAKITGKTSAHVHAGTHDINTWEKFSNLVKILCVYEPLIFKFGYGFKNEPEFFHQCWPEIKKATYTRIIDPKDADYLIKVIEGNYSDIKKCYSFLKFVHAEVFTRPVFNFRNFDFFKMTPESSFEEASRMMARDNDGVEPFIYPIGDHMEFRCFSGTLDTRIWMNNVDLVCRILYAVANDLVDMDYINYKFDVYRKKRYRFYKDLKDYSCENTLPLANDYNIHLLSYSSVNIEDALDFARIFYNLFPGDEVVREQFLKQYFKLFNEEDSLYLKLK